MAAQTAFGAESHLGWTEPVRSLQPIKGTLADPGLLA